MTTNVHNTGASKKRLIICCDGTWKSSDKGDHGDDSYETNVTRMCRAIATEGTSEGQRIPQIVYYQSGVGTGTFSRLSSTLAGGTGLGLEKNVMAAYHFLVNNYNPGDELFFFGFSRGSYTARSLAGLISDIGILPREIAHAQLPGLWKRYRAVQRCDDIHAGDGEIEALRKEVHSMDIPKIKVIGCWDTVGSLGIPENVVTSTLGINKRHNFHNTALSPNIENAFHALALDERRFNFSPTLWYIPTEPPKPAKNRASTSSDFSSTNLKQCWFPGVHTDVGRGYDDHVEGDFGDLSFAWMLDQCCGLLDFVREDKVKEIFERHDFKPCSTEKEKEQRQLRINAAKIYGGAPVHDSVAGIFKVGAKKTRTPGEYRFNAVEEVKEDLKWYNPKRWWKGVQSMFQKSEVIQCTTNETFHPSVRSKMLNDPTWVCKALAEFRVEQNGNKWTWLKEVNGQEVARIDEDEYPNPKQTSWIWWSTNIQKLLESKGSTFPERQNVPWYKFWASSPYVTPPSNSWNN